MKDKIDIKIKLEELGDEDPNFENESIKAKVDTLTFILGDADPITDEEMEPPTSDAELDQLIEVLRREREEVPRYSFFGDDNWRIVDAQIQICEWAKG